MSQYSALPLPPSEESAVFDLALASAGAEFFCPHCPPEVPLVGLSAGMVKAVETIRLVSQSRCNPILLLGETGTGKELAAQAVHAWRCGNPDMFVAVNCAALTANLLESELFGHVRGAFTGADREKVGLFELAGTGSIFLDEISEMPLDLQAKLLRVLQERVFRKVGGTRDIACQATIIASSNRELPQEIKAGRFRRDLYYRLAVFPIVVPPLRSPSRRGDIPLLAEYFLKTLAVPGMGRKRLSSQAAQMLMQHDWPGNVRELRNVMERAMILSRGTEITPACLSFEHNEFLACDGPALPTDFGTISVPQMPQTPLPVPTCPSIPAPPPEVVEPASVLSAPAGASGDFSLETAERELIIRALKETGYQRTRAASLLGITRATLHAKLKRYAIPIPGSKNAAGSDSQADAAEDAPLLSRVCA